MITVCAMRVCLAYFGSTLVIALPLPSNHYRVEVEWSPSCCCWSKQHPLA